MSNADKALRHNLRKLEELLWDFFGGGGSPSGFGGPWINVTHQSSPYAAKAGERKFLVDSGNGPVTIDLSSVPDGGLVFVKDHTGQAALNPITVIPASGSIEDPSNPGHQAGSGVISSQGESVIWQRIDSIGQLVAVVL